MTIRGVVVRTADTERRRRLRVSRPSARRLRDFRRAERIRAGASCRARAGRRTGHGVLHPAPRHPGRNDRHGREGGRTRRASHSHGDQRRLECRARATGHSHAGSGRCARTVRHAFPEHRFRSTDDPRHRHQRAERRVGSEFGDVPRRRLPRPTGDGVRAVSRSRSHRSASRAAGHLVWTQCGRWSDEPDLQGAHERLPGVRRFHRRELRRASRRRADQRTAQT